MFGPDNLLAHGFLTGDRVRTNCGLFDHVGTVSRRGAVFAASVKHGHLCEVSPHEFSGGRPITNEGHLGLRSRGQVLTFLEQRQGAPYCLLGQNCEHVNNEAHGLGRRSPQLAIAAVMIALGIAVLKR